MADLPFGRPAAARPTHFPLRVERGNVPLSPPPDLDRTGPFSALSPHGAWHRIPGVFRAQFVSADSIYWQAERSLTEQACVEFLLDFALPVALAFNGFSFRWGIAAAYEKQAALVLGGDASQASRRLLGLMSMGWEPLSEGLCTFRQGDDGGFEVFSGLPRIRTWDHEICLAPWCNGGRLRGEVGISAYEEEAILCAGSSRRLTHILLVNGEADGKNARSHMLRGSEAIAFLGRGKPRWLKDSPLAANVNELAQLVELSQSIAFVQTTDHELSAHAREGMVPFACE